MFTHIIDTGGKTHPVNADVLSEYVDFPINDETIEVACWLASDECGVKLVTPEGWVVRGVGSQDERPLRYEFASVRS